MSNTTRKDIKNFCGNRLIPLFLRLCFRYWIGFSFCVLSYIWVLVSVVILQYHFWSHVVVNAFSLTPDSSVSSMILLFYRLVERFGSHSLPFSHWSHRFSYHKKKQKIRSLSNAFPLGIRIGGISSDHTYCQKKTINLEITTHMASTKIIINEI